MLDKQAGLPKTSRVEIGNLDQIFLLSMFNIVVEVTQKHLITANPVFSLTYDSCMHCDTLIHFKLEFDSQQ